jgi:hypothetical protein
MHLGGSGTKNKEGAGRWSEAVVPQDQPVLSLLFFPCSFFDQKRSSIKSALGTLFISISTGRSNKV